MEPTVVACASLNQWTLDFKGNLERILESIRLAKQQHNAKLRVGPELEVTGFHGSQHFLEPDTILHSWEALAEILEFTRTKPYDDILCTIGLPISFRRELFNCVAFVHAGEIVYIKPKESPSSDDQVQPYPWASLWKGQGLEQLHLPEVITKIQGQTHAPIGIALLRTEDGYLIGAEFGDELWNPVSLSTNLFLQGAHIVANLSAERFEPGRLQKLGDMIKNNTAKTGGCFVMGNYNGCDGSTSYYDGISLIALNGSLVANTPRFQPGEVNVASGIVDLNEIDSFRMPFPTRNRQADAGFSSVHEVIELPTFKLVDRRNTRMSRRYQNFPQFDKVSKVLAALSNFLWDFLRRSSKVGILINEDDEEQTTACLAICRNMCDIIFQAYENYEGFNKRKLEADFRKLMGRVPQSQEDLMRNLVYGINLEGNNIQYFERLAEELCYNRISRDLKQPFEILQNELMGIGGNERLEVSVEYQNILKSVERRNRELAQRNLSLIIPASQGKSGSLMIVNQADLENAFVNQNVLGFADLYLLSNISLRFIRRLIQKLSVKYPITSESSRDESPQIKTNAASLETDEIYHMNYLQVAHRCGPLSLFLRINEDQPNVEKQVIARKVKTFFSTFARNQAYTKLLAPLIFVDSSIGYRNSAKRQILYNADWDSQFGILDRQQYSLYNSLFI